MEVCAYSGASNKIITRLTKLRVNIGILLWKVKLIDEDDVSYKGLQYGL